MIENKRYIDDGFEAIEDQSFTDTETDKTYYVDYFDEIIDLLNEQDEKIRKLTHEVVRLKLEPRLKQDKKSIKDAVEVNNVLKKQDKTIQNQRKHILLLKRKLEEHGIQLESKDYD